MFKEKSGGIFFVFIIREVNDLILQIYVCELNLYSGNKNNGQSF